jgi:hypothetical protein
LFAGSEQGKLYRERKTFKWVSQGTIAMAGKGWRAEEGQDVAEYAIMLAVLLVLALSATALIAPSTNNVFSSVSDFLAQL